MKTKAVTVAAMLGELIETHMAKCSADNPNDDIPHIISEVHQTKAFIESIGTASDLESDTAKLHLRLDDGSRITIDVQHTPVRKWTVFAFCDTDYGVHPMVLKVEGRDIAEAWDAAIQQARENEVGTIPAHGGKELTVSDIENMTEVGTYEGWLS